MEGVYSYDMAMTRRDRAIDMALRARRNNGPKDEPKKPKDEPMEKTFREVVLLYENKSLPLHSNLENKPMEANPRFEVTYLEEAADFLNSLDVKIRRKIQFNILKAQHENDPELFSKLNESIWEFRTRYNGMAYRLFAFWDKTTRSMVIATHGLVKKTQKTPMREISHAEAIMKLYYGQSK